MTEQILPTNPNCLTYIVLDEHRIEDYPTPQGTVYHYLNLLYNKKGGLFAVEYFTTQGKSIPLQTFKIREDAERIFNELKRGANEAYEKYKRNR